MEYDDRALTERTDLENQLRLNLSCANNVPAITWNFDTDAQGWTAWTDIANVRVEKGMWMMEATGADPILASPPVNVRGARFGAFHIKMRVRADQTPLKGDIYWRTRAMEDFSPALVASFDVLADDAMRDDEIILPVERGDTIAQLRFDPTDAPAQLAIDSVTIICR